MNFFSHKQKKHELKTESEEDLSVEDIIAEYQARQDVEILQEALGFFAKRRRP